MNKIHRQRFISFSLMLCGLAVALSLILLSLKQNINVFVTPKEITPAYMTSQYHFRLGGMVKPGSVKRIDHHHSNKLDIQFTVTDFNKDIEVHFSGVLPDLFREGKGVIATGKLNAQGIFIASEILAKHDENYMPRKTKENLASYYSQPKQITQKA